MFMFHFSSRAQRLLLADCSVAFFLSVGLSQSFAQDEPITPVPTPAPGLAATAAPCPTALCPPGSAKPPAPPKPTPIPPSPEFAPPPILPTNPDKRTAEPKAFRKKLLKTNPLLRPPFAGEDPESLKGMASGIKAVELDAPNRILAAQFLGTVDCVTYPQAQDILIKTMQEDPIEDVRYEAVLALRALLSHGCTNLDTECECESCTARKKAAEETKKHAAKAKKLHEKPKVINPDLLDPRRFKPLKSSTQKRRYDCCRGCCNDKAMNALAKVAYEADEFGCCLEPSTRVREAAVAGLSLCQCTPSVMEYGVPTIPLVPGTGTGKEEVDEAKPKEETSPPPATEGSSAQLAQPIHQVSLATPTAAPTNGQPKSIKALGGYCIMGLNTRQFLAAKPEFWSVFEERTYYFASAESKTEFDRNPIAYVPAYGGLDPVEFLESGTKVEGQFLREYEGRFYLFTTKENWEKFKATPARFKVSQ